MVKRSPAKPKSVVVVDAENPLAEVHGEFFWREDHDQIMASVREEAYRAGYQQGQVDAGQAIQPQQEVVLRYRPSFFIRLRRWLFRTAVLAGFVVLLVAVILE